MKTSNIKVGSTLFFLRDEAWREGVVDEVCTLRNYAACKDEVWVKLYVAGEDGSKLVEPSRLFNKPRRTLGETR